MTIIEAINLIDMKKPNTYTQEEKVRWLSTLDGIVKRLIIDNHAGAEDIEFTGYDDTTDVATELLVPAPYDEIYLFYLESKIDYYNGEYNKYNNSVTMYNNAYAEYENYYNRSYMPINKGRFLF